MPPVRIPGGDPDEGRQVDVVSIPADHADFVYLSLQRFGVRPADLEDLLQEVFIVVHRRLGTFDGSSKMRTWLFGICMRVAAGHRRRAFHRYEQQASRSSDEQDAIGLLQSAAADTASPEEAAMAAQQRARLLAILDAMDLEPRGLFVMFELDEVPCEEIAELLGVPIGTVYSRLHAARKAFQAATQRVLARESSRSAAAATRARRGGAR